MRDTANYIVTLPRRKMHWPASVLPAVFVDFFEVCFEETEVSAFDTVQHKIRDLGIV